MFVIKRNEEKQEFNPQKIINAIRKAELAVNSSKQISEQDIYTNLIYTIEDNATVEEIQDAVEEYLITRDYKVAKAFIVYRSQHKEIRFIKERAEYIEKYSSESDNAATASEIDANANIQNKNVATMEAELYKTFNTELSRYRIIKKLKEMYGDDAPDYIRDLNSHIIYKHDEGSSPATRPYCVAVNLYPFLNKGTATLDKLNTTAPQNLSSFTGQFGNLTFLLSSQFQGAVAFGEFFNVFYYYCAKE